MTAKWGTLLISAGFLPLSIGLAVSGAGGALAADPTALPAPAAPTRVVAKANPPTTTPQSAPQDPASARAATAEPAWPKTLPEVKADAGEEAKLDRWPQDDIIIAKAHCAQVLRGVQAEVEETDPIKEGECGTPAPVKLISVGRNPAVTFSPPPTLTCDMVVTLAGWLKDDVQPLARAHLGSEIVKIETMSSYSCRNAYGRKKTRLSEHARANAVDIKGFLTAAALAAGPLADWGMTEREVRAVVAAQATAEKMAAAERAKAAEVAKAEGGAGNHPAVVAGTTASIASAPTATASTASPAAAPFGFARAGMLGDSLGAVVGGMPGMPPAGAAQSGSRVTSFGFTEPSRLGGPKPQAMAAATPYVTDLTTRKALFLRAAHDAACRRFGTVLGPEANDYHRNHFHLDMAERATRNFCE